jgi:apolipoprotein N-acyltransferase
MRAAASRWRCGSRWFCYACPVLRIDKSAWLLVLLSAGLQILIFPLPDQYFLCWVAVAPLLVALLRTRKPDTLQLQAGVHLRPATTGQAFVLAYACGVLWYAGNCYWIYNTMRQYGALSAAGALGILILFCLYLALYNGAFGLLISILANGTLAGPREQSNQARSIQTDSGPLNPFNRRALLLAPFAWVAVELARTRITGFPWDLLGTTQVDNIPLARIATLTGVYGLSFEIMVVNTALATAFVIREERGRRSRRKPLLLAAVAAAAVLQAGRWISPPPAPVDHTARLVQQNVPVLEGSDWTKEYFEGTLQDLSWISLSRPSSNNPGPDSPGVSSPGAGGQAQEQSSSGSSASASPHIDLIVWPESPAPFYTTDPSFRESVSNMARTAQTWVLAGSLGIRNAGETPARATELYNSASLVSPAGEWVGRYDKMHLVPFGEYVPFKRVFGFAGGLTKEVGDFSPGTSRAPLQAGSSKLGVFICYESIFPDEVRQLAAGGAQVFVNTSNDGWYGDSGAYAQHLKQARMRAVENNRWLLRATNTGVTAAIDPYGRVVSTIPRKIRAAMDANYGLTNVSTCYTRHGDWFAYLCAIISVGGLLQRFFLDPRTNK